MWYLNTQFEQQSLIVGIFIFVFTLTLYNLFINFDEATPRQSVKKAFKEMTTGYFKIIHSPLVLLLIITGITEGLTDTVLDLMEGVIQNIWPMLPSHTAILNLSIISVSLFACVHISSYFGAVIKPSDKTFNWDLKLITSDINFILKLIEMTCYLLFIASIFSKWVNYVCFLLCMILMLGTLAVTNYYMVKLLYSIYSSAEHVVSSVAILENFSIVFIKFISSFVQNSENVYSVFIYCLVYFFLIRGLLVLFKRIIVTQESIKR